VNLASNLMGFGMPPLLAQEIGTVGSLTITAAGTSYTASTKIGANQYVVSCSNGDSTKSVGLPTIGGDSGASPADDFWINNAGTDSFVLRASTGVLLSAGGTSGDSKIVIGPGSTILMMPVSSTLWMGCKGG